jgi:hypothetical protein
MLRGLTPAQSALHQALASWCSALLLACLSLGLAERVAAAVLRPALALLDPLAAFDAADGGGAASGAAALLAAVAVAAAPLLLNVSAGAGRGGGGKARGVRGARFPEEAGAGATLGRLPCRHSLLACPASAPPGCPTSWAFCQPPQPRHHQIPPPPPPPATPSPQPPLPPWPPLQCYVARFQDPIRPLLTDALQSSDRWHRVVRGAGGGTPPGVDPAWASQTFKEAARHYLQRMEVRPAAPAWQRRLGAAQPGLPGGRRGGALPPAAPRAPSRAPRPA